MILLKNTPICVTLHTRYLDRIKDDIKRYFQQMLRNKNILPVILITLHVSPTPYRLHEYRQLPNFAL